MNNTTKEMTVREIERALGHKVKIVSKKRNVTAKKAGKRLYEIPVGETFKLGPFEFIILEHDYEYGTSVLLKDCWKHSEVRSDLNYEFYNQLASFIGKDNIIEHVVDLTADDGRKNYLWCNDYVSLLTVDLYKKHAHIINRYTIDSAWWLATAEHPLKNHDRVVLCIGNGSTLGRSFCDSNGGGIRPFCTLNPGIVIR